MEKWLTISEFPNYEVSDMGNVRNKATGRVLRPAVKKHSGRQSTVLRVEIMRDGRGQSKYIHRLVAAAFVPNPDGLPMVEHINGDFHDNRACNLRWSDRKSIMRSEIIQQRIRENNPPERRGRKKSKNF
ncbi:MAG: HNH endonuclease [Lentisphaeria bacterium]|nr:HNH endonuclease [Lentisphaeria bacterium]